MAGATIAYLRVTALGNSSASETTFNSGNTYLASVRGSGVTFNPVSFVSGHYYTVSSTTISTGTGGTVTGRVDLFTIATPIFCDEVQFHSYSTTAGNLKFEFLDASSNVVGSGVPIQSLGNQSIFITAFTPSNFWTALTGTYENP